MKKSITLLSIVLAMVTSCTSTPKIPENASSTQLIQYGQDAIEVLNYKAAEAYYNAVIQRYGMNTATYVEAKYELGHLYLKKKDYQKANACFREILEIFENAEIGSVPMSYKKLANIGMSKIPEKKRK